MGPHTEDVYEPGHRLRLEWALALAATGFKILELEPGSKKPIGAVLWGVEATTDPDKIKAMFESNPAMNYGVCPGKDHVIIDLDNKFNAMGAETFGKLEIENEILPETFKVRTRNAGFHIYLKVSEEVGNSHRFGKGSGIDVRGACGYVVGPGCAVAGESWGDGLYTPVEGDLDHIAECPAWVLPYLGKPAHRDPRAGDPLCELDLPHNIEEAERFLACREPAVTGDNGNVHTFETVAFVRDFGLSADMALEVILASEWNDRCAPPWAADELWTMIEHVWDYAQNRPGCKRTALSQVRAIRAEPVEPPDYREWKAERHRDAKLRLAEAVADNDNNAPHREQQQRTEDDLFPAYLVGELDQIPDPVWLIQDVLPEVSLGMTYGETGSLKTFLEIDKALWGAVGQPWAASDAHEFEGFKVTRKLRTVIVAGEGARGLKRRVAAWAKRHGIKTDDLPVLVIPVMPRFSNESDLNKLIRTIKAKLPNPDYIIVDTAMWAAAGLNLNVPADSQILLSSFKRVMLALGCSLTFVHHIGKDKKRGHLGAENLIAGVDVSDCVELEEKVIGRRKIKITNKKMKDAELREPISMEAYSETLGTDEDGRTFGSLVLRRCHGTKAKEADPRLNLAREIIAENKGKMPLSMNALAEEMARRNATETPTDGELEKAKEGMRNYLKKAVTGELAIYARKASRAKNAQWVFEDRR